MVMKVELANVPGVLATQIDIEFLRSCAEQLNAHPDQLIELVSSDDPVRNRFLITTLIHFGVSCGKIRLVY